MKALRIKLSVLWIARMLSGLQGDSTRLHDPVALADLVGGTSAVQVSNELLLIMSLIFTIPIIMPILCLTLKDKANRWVNRTTGTFFALFDLAFLILFAWPFSYETVWSVMYLVFTALIAWYAWKWPGKEVESS